MTSRSTASTTARNSAALSANWWYIAPRVTPAAAAISGVPTSAKPRAAHSRRAAATKARRVAVDRCSWVLPLLSIHPAGNLQTDRLFVTIAGGTMPTVTLDAGTIHYDVTGAAGGRPVVFVHGYEMASSLWGPLSARLSARGLRCFAPTWPLGSHPEPLRPGADRTLPGVAAMVDAFLAALDLDDVVLVGNDTGGLVAQLVAVTHPDRLGALVLTSCDAFEHFPPPILKPLILASRTTVTWRAAVKPLGLKAVRKRAYGDLAHRDVEPLAARWVRPALDDPRVAEDLRRLTASL